VSKNHARAVSCRGGGWGFVAHRDKNEDAHTLIVAEGYMCVCFCTHAYVYEANARSAGRGRAGRGVGSRKGRINMEGCDLSTLILDV
jgi:hypothetical protein